MLKKITLCIILLFQIFNLNAQNKKVVAKKFKEEEVRFVNKKDSDTLSGTLTYPLTGEKFPAVILISGSGPSDRDETIFNKYKPFKILAEYLSENGYAVLRYDDRGCGRSTGKPYPKHTSADLAQDVLAAVDYLKTKSNVLANKIGLAGHSEGGMIAPMVAKDNKDIAFIISLAGAGCKITEVMEQQNRAIFSSYSKTYVDHYIEFCYNPMIKEVISGNDSLTIYKNIVSVYGAYHKAVPDSEFKTFVRIADTLMARICMYQVYTPWFRYFLSYNPTNDWKHVKQPVLALNGTKDVQVDAAQNLACIKAGLTVAENKNFKVLSLEGYNHLFQKAKTGALTEYTTLDDPFDKPVLEIIVKWLNELP
jgi:uncharacterized protein